MLWIPAHQGRRPIHVPLGSKGNSKENWVTHPAGASTTCVHSLGGPSCLLAGFPSGKVASKNKEFPANLNDWNTVFFNDSAEMPDRKPCEFGGGGNVHKHLRSSWVGCRSLSQYHSLSSLSTRFMHLAFQCANPPERVMKDTGSTLSIWFPQGSRSCHFPDK